jgi:tetratricopeptide (TPR) repeat protein
MGNWERAHRDYSHILDLDPQHRQALTYRAYIDMRQHHYEEAKQDYTKALSLYPDDETARAGYAVLLQEMGKLSEAIHQLSVLVEQHPERTEYLVMRAEIEVANSQPELALYDLDKAIEKDKSNKDYYLKRGYLLYEGKKYRAAHADFEQAVRLGVPRDTLKSLLKKSK